MTELLFKDEVFSIIGACMKVHRTLGPGFLESVYSEALEKELTTRNIPHLREIKLEVQYEGKPMNKFFKADFLCFDKIIMELKSKTFLLKIDEQQTINYIKAANLPVGLLVNFGEKSLRWKRFANTKANS
ncbi:GxxExxY protein [Prolixibacter denitrificans]|uniref:GxxExxY protein n=1 Tax=Prolixibacter denitrificans TaxID=1541063 RepID=A0A2P8C8N1_9BACT|nr:GxxExxY protein [Prolixibacter denitrificans]PSK81322.1 GxxExxY protein [Prolixibacter denitrificans]GET21593.1 hypothetical protein JCM18694_18390 [Prolixibacter denitrificans]